MSMNISNLDGHGNSSLAANGSGWSCNYNCRLYYDPDLSIPITSLQDGFVLRVRSNYFLDVLYLRKFVPLNNRNHNSTVCLPPTSLSTMQNVNSFVTNMLETIGVPTTEQDSLVRLIFSFGCRCRHNGSFGLVPLALDFKIVTVLRNQDEALDWYFGGTMNSVVVRTLRATRDAIDGLEKTKIDAASSCVDKCMVCLERFEEEVTWMPCSHGYHEDCIREWLRSNHRCPICRFPMPWVSCMLGEDVTSPLSIESKSI